jgi:SHS2 domain-containing protein
MFELFEHTADLGLRVTSIDLDGLFRDAASGLFAMIAEPAAHGRPAGRRAFEITGERHDFLMVDWLTELLYVFDTERLLSGEFEVTVDGRGLRASAACFTLDVGDYQVLREVKAITYHGLKVERTADGWLAEVIVDI